MGFFLSSIEVWLARKYSGQEMSVGLDGSHERVSIRMGKLEWGVNRLHSSESLRMVLLFLFSSDWNGGFVQGSKSQRRICFITRGNEKTNVPKIETLQFDS